MPTLKLFFVIPDPDTFVSGGNIYNNKIINSLGREGIEVHRISLDQFKIIQGTDKSDGYYFLDTLFLEQLDLQEIHTSFFKENCYLIVHHLESLYPTSGLDSDTVFKQKEFPFLRLFKGFLTTSTFTKSYLISKGLKDKVYIVVPPAIDKKITIQKRKAEQIDILLVANIIERKGIFEFLQALHNAETASATITIIGSKRHESAYALKCEDFINKSPLLKKIVTLKGEVKQEEMPHYYQKANLFVSTAYMETFGMAIQEAVYYRLPLLVLNGGNSSAHIEDGINGLVAEDMDHIVTKIKLLTTDKTYFDNLSNQAWTYRLYEKYTWKNAAESFLQQLKNNTVHLC